MLIGISALWLIAVLLAITSTSYGKQVRNNNKRATQDVFENATQKITDGQQAFRFDTFGDQAFWGDTLRLHEAIEGAALGGVGPGVSPKTALTVGLKIDVDALPANVVANLLRGGSAINLNDPAATVALLKLNAVVGLTGFFFWRQAAIHRYSMRSLSFHRRQRSAFFVLRCDYPESRHRLYRASSGWVVEP
jgi:hypothetical protein